MMMLDADRCAEYAKEDWIGTLLAELAHPGDESFTSHRWLLESLPKRMVYGAIYGDLLRNKAPARRILDVGGGYTALSRRIVARHDYTLLDIAAHDQAERLRAEERQVGRRFWEDADWYEFDPRPEYDLVIANDLFPNVDQRLRAFLERYLPCCRAMRLSLTYYQMERWYRVRREDAEEIMHLVAWDGAALKRVLEAFREHVCDPQLEQLDRPHESAFPNKRQVCLVELVGGRARGAV